MLKLSSDAVFSFRFGVLANQLLHGNATCDFVLQSCFQGLDWCNSAWRFVMVTKGLGMFRFVWRFMMETQVKKVFRLVWRLRGNKKVLRSVWKFMMGEQSHIYMFRLFSHVQPVTKRCITMLIVMSVAI